MANRHILERDVERNLVDAVEKRGGIAYKFSSPNRRNVPDRLIILPNCAPFFVECKRPGEGPSKGQAREIARLHRLGQPVYLLDNPDPEYLLQVAAP